MGLEEEEEEVNQPQLGILVELLHGDLDLEIPRKMADPVLGFRPMPEELLIPRDITLQEEILTLREILNAMGEEVEVEEMEEVEVDIKEFVVELIEQLAIIPFHLHQYLHHHHHHLLLLLRKGLQRLLVDTKVNLSLPATLKKRY